MKSVKPKDLPFHIYSEASQNVNIKEGHPYLSIQPNFPFVMTRFEIMNSTAQSNYPHRHDYFEILFVEEGEGQHILDYEPYEIKPPVFYFLSKGQIHFWKLTKPLKGKVLLFPREFLIPHVTGFNVEDDLLIFNSLSKSPELHPNSENLSKFHELYENIWEEFTRESDRSISVLRAYSHILLAKLFRIYAGEQSIDVLDPENTLARKFRQLVAENFLHTRSVQEYADLIGISATHLRDSVKEVTGYSPGQLIRQEIIFEAKRRLANTELTTSEISYTLNFEDTSYFSRFFKRETGKSPSAYREEVRKRYQISM